MASLTYTGGKLLEYILSCLKKRRGKKRRKSTERKIQKAKGRIEERMSGRGKELIGQLGEQKRGRKKGKIH